MNYISQYDNRDYPREFIALKLLQDVVKNAVDKLAKQIRVIDVYKFDDKTTPLGTMLLDYTDFKLSDLRNQIESSKDSKLANLVFNFKRDKDEIAQSEEENVKMSRILRSSPRDSLFRCVFVRVLEIQN